MECRADFLSACKWGLKQTMPQILLKQTDSEIHFDVVYNKKGKRMIKPILKLLDLIVHLFLDLFSASFEVLRAIT